MKNLIAFVSIVLTYNLIQATNTTDSKTKRGLIGQTFYYGEPPTVRVIQAPAYHDLAGSAATHPSSNQRSVIIQTPNVPIKPDNDTPKQVTVQHILYEFQQQTPSNIVANVPVSQQYQTATEQKPEIAPTNYVNHSPVLNVEPNQYNGIVTPVQHGAVINHGQSYTKLLYNPYNIQTANPQQKLIYPNGKVLPQPLTGSLQNSINNPYALPIRTANYLTNLNYQQRPVVVTTQKPFKPSPFIPITYNRYQTQPTPAIKPTQIPVKEVEDEDSNKEEKAEVHEEVEEDDDSEDHSNYEEEEEDEFRPKYYSRYRYEDDDEDHDHEHYREEDEDEDSSRSYSKYVKKSPKKSVKGERNPKYSKSQNYKSKRDYEKSKKYASSYKNPHTSSHEKKPKGEYKTYKYYKSSSNLSPKKETLEGHQSQNIPVVHNKKIIRQEKWLITKKDSEQ